MSSKPFGTVNTTEFDLKWNINVYSDELGSKTTGECVTSSTFVTHSFGQEIKWLLKLHPKGIAEDNKEFMSIFLFNKSDFKVEASVRFFLRDKNNKKVVKKKVSNDSMKTQLWGFGNFVEQSFVMDPKNDLIKDGEMTIGCHIVVNSILIENPKSFNRLDVLDDFENLLINENCLDFSIYSSDKVFYVDKHILAARCPELGKMMRGSFGEKDETSITLEDITGEVLLEVLRFLYCGKVNNLDKLLLKILTAAVKYQIEGLKVLCEETMIDKLDKTNALEYLIAAKKGYCSNVAKIISYIVEIAKDLVKTEEFESLSTEHPKLMFKITKALANKKISV